MSRCSRCSGPVMAEADGALVCIFCGERRCSHAESLEAIIDSMDCQARKEERHREKKSEIAA